MVLASQCKSWKALRAHAESDISATHLRDLLADDSRNASMNVVHNGIMVDYSRQRMTSSTMDKLVALYNERGVQEKIESMFKGEHLNSTEDRAVLHVALRAQRGDGFGDIEEDVLGVLARIKEFVGKVRSGEWKGITGKNITDVVSIGIGGSYLGGEFLAEALRGSPEADGRRLRFLANVDPVAVSRATEGLDPETTMVVVISKTFTTAETMLNARTMRKWVVDALGADAVPKHMIAVSANVAGAVEFGMDKDNVFGFWDWVGGRYSVCSAVGIMPLALQYGFDIMEKFLAGARDMDIHFRTAPPTENLPVILGLLGVWNSSFLGHGVRALLPYAESMVRFAAHLQQVDMESNGKGVNIEGETLDFDAGEVDFGEPGTNGQHSFYQLIHQGRVVPCDFIGFVETNNPIMLDGEVVSNHDELMSNFFAQPDALALGKTRSELVADGVAEDLLAHKEFTGNRPSTSILVPRLDAYYLGQLLSLYEHRTAVQGFIWGVNSFDQWGVELGKVLGKKVRTQLHNSRSKQAGIKGFNSATSRMMEFYLSGTK